MRIGIMGDVMLGRMVNEMIVQTNMSYPWGNILPLLHKNDLNIINLETTLTKSNDAVPKIFNFKAHPEIVQGLVNAKIDIASLANNHILDFSLDGMQETIRTLDTHYIQHVGAGITKEHAMKPARIAKNGFQIVILGCTDNESSWAAAEHTPGVWFIDPLNPSLVQEALQAVQNVRPHADLLLFSIHWGPNMRERPSREFQHFAHQLIDAGVDILHGHSAHVFQGIEVYKHKLILYDTGNFIDDYAVDPELRNDLSLLYCIQADKQGIHKAELIPVIINRLQVNKAIGEDSAYIAMKIKRLSKEFGTEIKSEKGTLFVSL